jgi:hypothetical protein
MAEEILVKETLTDRMIQAGEWLTNLLDKSGWPVVASFWSFDPEINRWRLLLASPEVDAKGPLDSYGRVNAALRTAATPKLDSDPDGEGLLAPLRHLTLDSVSVISPGDRRVQILASAFPPPKNLAAGRVYRTAIGGHYFDDVYFYRLPAVASAA